MSLIEKVKRFSHPLHPPLILISSITGILTPICYAGALMIDNLFLLRLGAILAGVTIFFGLMGTLPGFIDFALAEQGEGKPSAQKFNDETSLVHVIAQQILSIAGLVAYMASLLYCITYWNSPEPPALVPLLLTLAGGLARVGSLYMGYRLFEKDMDGVEVSVDRKSFHHAAGRRA